MEDARRRTAHQLFVDQAGAEGSVWWHSSPESIDEPSTDVRHLPAPLKHGLGADPLTPTSSPIQIGTTTRDKGKGRQVDHFDVLPKIPPMPTTNPDLSMQQSPPIYQSHSPVPSTNDAPVSDHLTRPLADVNNLLGKWPAPLTLPRPSMPRARSGHQGTGSDVERTSQLKTRVPFLITP